MMKRLCLLLAALLVLPACAAAQVSSTSHPLEPSPQPSEAEGPDKLYVADAALYRGAVVSVEAAEGGTLIRLEQAPGTDFGAPALTFLFGENTTLSFDPTLLQEGAYVEAFYGVAPGQTVDPQAVQDAIAANVYFEAAMVNFNGELVSIEPNAEKPGEGRFYMKELGTRMDLIFHYSDATQFYLDFADLSPGDHLNIFHRGTMTLSLPPQGSALEVRLYTPPA